MVPAACWVAGVITADARTNGCYGKANLCCNFIVLMQSITTEPLVIRMIDHTETVRCCGSRVEDFDAVVNRAIEMGVEMVLPKHRNPSRRKRRA